MGPTLAPLEVKLRIMLRNWSYPEFKEILYKEAKEGKDYINTNTYKRIYAYLRTLELRKQGLSYNKIRRAINSEMGYTPPKSELSYWLRGLWLGDGHIGKEIRFINTDLKLIETVEKLLSIQKIAYTKEGPYRSKPGNLPEKPYKPLYMIRVASISLQRFLKLTNLPKALHALS